MAHYVIAHRHNDVYAVTRFSDSEFPDHIGTLDYKKKKLNFNFYHKVTESTLEKYMALVGQFIKDGEPESTVYFASEDSPPKVTSYCYAGTFDKPEKVTQKKKPANRKIAAKTVAVEKKKR